MNSITRLLPLILLTLTLTGCVTRGYRLADDKVPPAVDLNLHCSSDLEEASSQPGIDVTLRSVIVYRGPGSWKREAYWDEYVVSIENRGETPLMVSTAALHTNSGESLTPGDNPWKLESLSRTWWKSNAAQQTGTYLLLGAGTAAGVGIAAAGVMSVPLFAPVTGGAAVAAGVGTAAAVGLPLVAVGTLVINVHRKHQVEAEFVRRRLVLPLSVAPGETAQGSLFFRLAPGPQQLVIEGTAGDGPVRAVTIDLDPLSGLHLKPIAIGSTADKH